MCAYETSGHRKGKSKDHWGDSTTFRELHNGQEEQEKINTQARKMRPPTAPTWF